VDVEVLKRLLSSLRAVITFTTQDGQTPEDLDLDPTITNIIDHWRDRRAAAVAAAAAQEAAAEGEKGAEGDGDTGSESDSGSDDGEGDGDGQGGESDSV
jgi:hypothetical protein